MANRTDPRAHQVHGTNPQFLIDKLTRLKVYNDSYFKEKCFALTAETLIDRAFEDLKYVGGTFGAYHRPCKFLCLLLKMLQIQPDEDIVLEFVRQTDHKYLRALGAMYFRMTCHSHARIFKELEPLYSDYRRMTLRVESEFSVLHVDEFIQQLLTKDKVFGILLPRISKRHVLEEDEELEPY